MIPRTCVRSICIGLTTHTAAHTAITKTRAPAAVRQRDIHTHTQGFTCGLKRAQPSLHISLTWRVSPSTQCVCAPSSPVSKYSQEHQRGPQPVLDPSALSLPRCHRNHAVISLTTCFMCQYTCVYVGVMRRRSIAQKGLLLLLLLQARRTTPGYISISGVPELNLF